MIEQLLDTMLEFEIEINSKEQFLITLSIKLSINEREY